MNTARKGIGLATVMLAVTMCTTIPANACGYGYCPPPPPKVTGGGAGGGSAPWPVICIGGSALGLIWAANAKATALGNPPRWRSQAEHERIVASGIEKKYELTNGEAAAIGFTCGAGAFGVVAKYRHQQPMTARVPVVAKY